MLVNGTQGIRRSAASINRPHALRCGAVPSDAVRCVCVMRVFIFVGNTAVESATAARARVCVRACWCADAYIVPKIAVVMAVYACVCAQLAVLARCV